MILHYAHSIGTIAKTMAESNLKGDMVLWSCPCHHNIGKLQIALENSNVPPDMYCFGNSGMYKKFKTP